MQIGWENGTQKWKFNGPCSWCAREASFIVRATHGSVAGQACTLISCPACAGVTTVHFVFAKEAKVLAVLPPPARKFPHANFREHTPTPITAALEETYSAYQAGAKMPASLGARRVVELVVGELEVKHSISPKQKLKPRLKDLLPFYPGIAGPIQMADAVRLFGNGNAHEDDFEVAPEQVTLALAFVEQLILQLFVIPGELAKFTSTLPNAQDAVTKQAG